ncbi:sarcosine oxidase subunit beta [Nocardia amikacinitolerans]|uniref:Sarcosine oxidase subunit beta n=1 Tax=Nocardia amikacinitolerans TaxID=756689 RepID=A0A285LTY7_9NOCA|nr:FAD-binding oxidoreductase [Nocardia amikacinitolerans]SNY88389.1 sarcosine oxidase subunit beta [Nocardia amikacinitolerans]
MDKARIVVIGAGAVGLATALELSTSDRYDVTVLDREHIAEGSLSRSVGIIETQYIDEFDIRVRAFGLRFARDLAQRAGLHLTANGYLRLAESDQTMAAFALSVERQHRQGIADARLLSRAEITDLIPFLDMADRVGGLLGPSDSYVDGHLFAHVMADLARHCGVRIRQRTKLLGASSTGHGAVELSTDQGDFTADYVVNAAGAWAGQVADTLGAPVAVHPQRHQAVTVILDEPFQRRMPSVMDYVPGSGRTGLYLRPEGDRRLFAGLHSEESFHDTADPDDYSNTTDADFIEQIAEALDTRLAGLETAQLGQGWAGLFPMSFDAQPVVGPHPDNPQVICALGAGGNGIQLAPAIGRTVREYLDGVRPSLAGPGSKWDPARMASPPSI